MNKLHDIVRQMTLKEKAGLCSGLNFWQTKAVERLGIPSVTLADGPHGLRKTEESTGGTITVRSYPATCFPTASISSCSFDLNLIEEMGAAVAEEARQRGVAVLLGPAVNIKRSPLCGRNFEYVSEDPYLAGEFAAAFVKGVQSKNVGATLKHFACNNQEYARMINDSLVDERTFREIYLTPFEIAVKKASPWAIMCSYNKVNGTYASVSRELLTEIPREEWGFAGMMMTDWGAMEERVPALEAGLDLEMPNSGRLRDERIAAAVRAGQIKEELLDESVYRILKIVEKVKDNSGKKDGKTVEKYKRTEKHETNTLLNKHHDLARRVLCQSAVLLKNRGILPLAQTAKIALIGEFASKPRYQGAGSSRITPTKLTSAVAELERQGISFDFARGYDIKAQAPAEELINEAERAARGKDAALIYAGMTEEYESEGFDRENIYLPVEHNKLIERVAAVNPNTVVVLQGGSAMAMPWLDRVKGVLLLGLGGQCSGGASVDLLFGRVNPSGRLSETYINELQDNPSYLNFGKRLNSEYRETVYVGYRYYDKARKEVLFPFGFGLSYTDFRFSNLRLSADRIHEKEELSVTVNIKNTGDRVGKEVVQLYVSPPESLIYKPEKELKAFAKLSLEPGENRDIELKLGRRAFAYWNVYIHDWHVESGTYTIKVGKSAEEIELTAEVEVVSAAPKTAVPSYQKTAPCYYKLNNEVLDLPQEQFAAVYGREITGTRPGSGPFTINSTLSDARDTFIGKILYKAAGMALNRMASGSGEDETFKRMMQSMLNDLPLRGMTMSGMSLGIVEALVELLNGRYLKGIGKIIRSLHLL